MFSFFSSFPSFQLFMVNIDNLLTRSGSQQRPQNTKERWIPKTCSSGHFGNFVGLAHVLPHLKSISIIKVGEHSFGEKGYKPCFSYLCEYKLHPHAHKFYV